MSARTMIVTGASSGIGRAVALAALERGYGVVAVGRRAPLLEGLVSAGDDGGSVETLPLDLLEPGAAARIVSAALRRYGSIDVVVNAAGAVASGPISEQSDCALREQFMLHAIVPLALLREALPMLAATRGHVFFVGSGVARVPVGGMGAYPPSKAAVRNAARIARAELRGTGVAVTYVDPGAVDTDFMRRGGFAGAPKRFAASPRRVAEKILTAVGSRRAVLNASPWQSAAVALGAALPSIAEALVARFPGIVGATPLPAPPAHRTKPAPPAANPAPPEPPPAVAGTLDAALAAHARRMERLKLPRAFVAALLRPGDALQTEDVALRWAGMPNKNERALVHDVLEALADAGFLERSGPGRYTVLRPAEGGAYQ